LAATQLPRFAIEQIVQAQQLGCSCDPGFDFRSWRFAHAKSETQVLADGHVGIECVILKDHCQVPFAGLQLIHPAVGDSDLPAGRFLEAREHPQRRRLSAT
jgi:hypothetical protein